MSNPSSAATHQQDALMVDLDRLQEGGNAEATAAGILQHFKLMKPEELDSLISGRSDEQLQQLTGTLEKGLSAGERMDLFNTLARSLSAPQLKRVADKLSNGTDRESFAESVERFAPDAVAQAFKRGGKGDGERQSPTGGNARSVRGGPTANGSAAHAPSPGGGNAVTSAVPFKASGPGSPSPGDRKQFEQQFEGAMRDTALKALDSSQAAAQQLRDRLTGHELTPQDRAALERTVKQLQPLDDKISTKEKQVNDAYKKWADLTSTAPRAHTPEEVIQAQAQASETYRKRDAELADLQAQRSVIAKDFPLALRIDNLAQFQKMSASQQAVALRGAADSVLNDVATTRANVLNGKLNLWMINGIRNATAAGLGVKGQQLTWVEDRAAGERRTDAEWKMGETVLTVGLAVGGSFVSGGLSLGLLGASSALGLHGAMDTTLDHFRDQAAANTALDPAAGLIPQDMVGSWAFVAAAWIGVGLDAGAVVNAVRALRAGASFAEATKSLNLSQQQLKQLQGTLAASKVSAFKASVLSDQAFTARMGSEAGDAVTLVRPSGRGFAVEIITRDSLEPEARAAAVQEELVHVQQLSDPALSEHFARLTEDKLAHWPQMSPTERMQAIRSQLTIESDAQHRLMAEGGRMSDDLGLEDYDTRLAAIEKCLHDGKPPAGLDKAEPPRLFSHGAGKWPKTRLELDADLKSKGFVRSRQEPSPGGYVYYTHTDGRRVTIKPTGEVIPTSRATSADGKSYSQRTDYDFNRLPDQSHSTGQFVEPYRKGESQ